MCIKVGFFIMRAVRKILLGTCHRSDFGGNVSEKECIGTEREFYTKHHLEFGKNQADNPAAV